MMSGGDARGTERTKQGHRRRARRGAGGGAPHGRTARERETRSLFHKDPKVLGRLVLGWVYTRAGRWRGSGLNPHRLNSNAIVCFPRSRCRLPRRDPPLPLPLPSFWFPRDNQEGKMPPPTKRQKKDSAGSGALHEDESGYWIFVLLRLAGFLNPAFLLFFGGPVFPEICTCLSTFLRPISFGVSWLLFFMDSFRLLNHCSAVIGRFLESCRSAVLGRFLGRENSSCVSWNQTPALLVSFGVSWLSCLMDSCRVVVLFSWILAGLWSYFLALLCQLFTSGISLLWCIWILLAILLGYRLILLKYCPVIALFFLNSCRYWLVFRQSCPAAGQAKAAANKKQRKNSADGTLLKDEW